MRPDLASVFVLLKRDSLYAFDLPLRDTPLSTKVRWILEVVKSLAVTQ